MLITRRAKCYPSKLDNGTQISMNKSAKPIAELQNKGLSLRVSLLPVSPVSPVMMIALALE